MNARVLTAAAVVAALPWLPGAPRARAEGGPPPQAVRVEEIRAEKHRVHRRATGAVRAVRRALVAAREPGIVESLEVREGAAVRKGDLLARLDSARLDHEAATAEADVLEAGAAADALRAEEERARRDLAALEALASRDAARPKEREDAASAVDAAAARVRAAAARAASLAARRDLLRRRIADAAIRAPFDGAVIGLRTEVGAWVGEGEAVVELASSELEVQVAVPQASLAALRAHGGRLRVAVDATGAELDLEGVRIVPDVSPSGRTFAALAPVPADAGLVPGMSVAAQVPSGEEGEFLTVSRAAVLRGPQGPYVFAVAAGAGGAPPAADLVPVEVLFSTGDRAAVRAAGLVAGRSVVVEGNERLFPGAPLIPAPAAPGSPAGGGR